MKIQKWESFNEKNHEDWGEGWSDPNREYINTEDSVSPNNLTNEEKTAIKALNFVSTHDGIIQPEEKIIYILKEGIRKFIPRNKRILVRIDEDNYPIQIKY